VDAAPAHSGEGYPLVSRFPFASLVGTLGAIKESITHPRDC